MLTKERPKPFDEDGYPIKRYERCFKCQKKFCLTFSFSQQNYSRKNSWFYWTEKEEDKEKYICSPCLRLFYTEQKKEILKAINPKKRSHLSSYINRNII